jgi:hypothetical protein
VERSASKKGIRYQPKPPTFGRDTFQLSGKDCGFQAAESGGGDSGVIQHKVGLVELEDKVAAMSSART